MSYSMKAKLMIAVTSATVLGMSAFMEPAAAQRVTSGNTYFNTGTDQESVIAKFSLIATGEDGQCTFDAVTESPTTCLFTGAIQNYTLGSGSLRDVDRKIRVDSEGNYISGVFNAREVLPGVGNLKADINRNNSPAIFAGREFIQYSIVAPAGSNQNTLVYGLDFLNPNFSIQNAFRPADLKLPVDFDKDAAIKSLSYILDNNLLGLTEGIGIGGSLNQIVLREKFEQGVPVASLPEPSFTLGLLAVLGAGSLLKRKIKQS
ncbi:PEP-CTERM sorting domain-containing protein [Microseira wollei]|uniref:PEP-CTERM protein-sorting domain-containing protein n=1 Tax=Microseira wollei NIES-4236 TaxID=2530354 RepID=A0AAV3X3Q9_9CYAN|nr:PEP-CTERM sorting domain-containing protein [Microseira wollei]GET36663.1 hypothetical protein MiSe_14150 [Microseira wollei NIES-4236]